MKKLDRLPLRRALISVYDKTGLEDFARGLHEAGVALVSKRSEELSKAIIMAIMVEFYAILCLLASFLMLNSL